MCSTSIYKNVLRIVFIYILINAENMSESECISVHVGQAGMQIGDACWELFQLEHGITTDGQISAATYGRGNNFFKETSEGKYVPRALFVDLEPSVVDIIRNGGRQKLYEKDQFLAGSNGTGGTYAQGRHTAGEQIIEQTMEQLRKMSEACSNPQGFFVYHSLGGGTGSGFSSLLMEKLTNEYGNKSKIEFSIYPAPQIKTSEVEPYNSTLATHTTLEHSDCTFMVDNEAVFNVCKQGLGVETPTFDNLNRLIAQIFSSITASLRFDGTLHTSMVEFKDELVPRPRLHFPIASYAPVVASKNESPDNISVQDITRECFEPFKQMVTSEPVKGKYMACSLSYRGDVHPKDVNAAIAAIQSEINFKFAKDCTPGFKVGINYTPPKLVPDGDMADIPRALCVLGNNTAIVNAWTRLREKFDTIYAQRAFLDLYLLQGGMEESDFKNARDNLAALEEEYVDAATD